MIWIKADLNSKMINIVNDTLSVDPSSSPEEAEHRIRELNKYDPTGLKAEYTRWLNKIDSREKIHNLDFVKEILVRYDELKQIKPSKFNPDILSFKSVNDLEHHVMDFEEEESESGKEKKEREKAVSSYLDLPTVKSLGSKGSLKVVEISDPSSIVRFLKMFDVTSWCIKEKSYAKRYSPVYFILDSDAPVAAWSFYDKTLSDRSNKSNLKKEWVDVLSESFPKFKDWFNDEYDLKIPKGLYEYVKDVVKDRFSKGEDIISKDPEYSYKYARDIIKGRWPEGEEAISKDPKYSYLYIKDVIEGRWPKGEDAISKDPKYSYLYAYYIIKGRFLKGEDAISKDPEYSYLYIKDVIEGRWPKGEDAISKNPYYSYFYAAQIIERRFPKGEDAISKDPKYSYLYAKDVIKGRWEKGENILSKDPYFALLYVEYAIKDRFPEGEDVILKSAWKKEYLDFLKSKGHDVDKIFKKKKSSLWIKSKSESILIGEIVIQDHYTEKHPKTPHLDLRLQIPEGSLKEYKKKRKEGTPEPLDDKEGVLMSFAITKHKMPEAGKKVLAIKTEDHPLSYSDDYDIPSGHYGAGKLTVVYKSDNYELLEAKDDEYYKFKIFDGKYEGIYYLTRIEDTEKNYYFGKYKEGEKESMQKPLKEKEDYGVKAHSAKQFNSLVTQDIETYCDESGKSVNELTNEEVDIIISPYENPYEEVVINE